jgi:micrococcal nuclease
VIDVIDGDTIDVELNGREERVRYYGIDTPERGDDCFSEARRRNQELVGDAVLLLPDARERDRSGRLLRYVFDASGNSIDGQLIAEGLAYAWRDDGSHRDLLIGAEDGARAARAGCLWGG